LPGVNVLLKGTTPENTNMIDGNYIFAATGLLVFHSRAKQYKNVNALYCDQRN